MTKMMNFGRFWQISDELKWGIVDFWVEGVSGDAELIKFWNLCSF
jgi:hypothetical protein